MLLRLTVAAAALAVGAPLAQASCGSTSCSLMTDRYAQGAGSTHPGWSLDLRLESVTQDKLRSGTGSPSDEQLAAEEALERHTKNRSLVASLGWTLDADWSFTLRAPLLRRDHLHDLIDEETGQPGAAEQWTFTKLGDVQLLARRQFADGADDAFAVFGGLKLPTGATDVVNGDGARAERALQPGSGTTDLVLGAAWRRAVGPSDALIGQLGVTQALNGHEGFRPGRRLEASIAWSHAWSAAIGSVLQLNARHRRADSGEQSEPDQSGSTTLDLSPGLTFAVGPASTLYAYLQLPVYQKVRGVQLVPRRALALGWTMDF